MYYYIFDPPQGAKEYERVAQIKELLSTLGIAGEMATPQPGRSVEDLVNLAVSKRYSTVIAVGGMELANRVAKALEPYDVVFGIIPSSDHPDVSRLIGTSDWKVAADQLKRRRWQPIRLGLLNDVCFLTPASLTLPKATSFRVVTPSFEILGAGGSITMTPERNDDTDGLAVTLEPLPEKPGLLKRLLGSKAQAPTLSRFVVPWVQIETSEPAEALVAGVPLASTPLVCSIQEKAVRLIVAKGSGTA